MKVGIIVHSQSGHTVTFARAIAERLSKAGIEYDIELLRTKGIVKPRKKHVEFLRLPDISGYDIVLFGAPVWAFTISPAIIAFMRTIKSLKGKKALPFITHSLFAKVCGAERALKIMGAELEELSADLLEGEHIHFFIGANKAKLNAAAERIVERVKG
jgi:flavodoxin